LKKINQAQHCCKSTIANCGKSTKINSVVNPAWHFNLLKLFLSSVTILTEIYRICSNVNAVMFVYKIPVARLYLLKQIKQSELTFLLSFPFLFLKFINLLNLFFLKTKAIQIHIKYIRLLSWHQQEITQHNFTIYL